MNDSEPRIATLEKKYLIGMHLQMTLTDDRTFPLWRAFKARIHEVHGRTDGRFYSMQVFDASTTFAQFTPHTLFDKWAAVEVHANTAPPEGMSAYTLHGGRYAVFAHRGPASTFPLTMRYIFTEWFPASQYAVDAREHLAIMDANYLNPEDPANVEEIWVPVKVKIPG